MTENYVGFFHFHRLKGFYEWAQKQSALVQFNHPGDVRDNFGDLVFDRRIQTNMVAIETGNGTKGNIHGNYLKYYDIALGKGWKVAPTNNQDNHKLQSTSFRTAILAESLTSDALLQALSKRRVYSVDDPNMKVSFKTGSHWMGETIVSADKNAMHKFDIEVQDDEPVQKVQLIGKNGRIVEELDAQDKASVSWQPIVQPEASDYYYVKVFGKNLNEQADGEVQIAVTAPIWISLAVNL